MSMRMWSRICIGNAIFSWITWLYERPSIGKAVSFLCGQKFRHRPAADRLRILIEIAGDGAIGIGSVQRRGRGVAFGHHEWAAISEFAPLHGFGRRARRRSFAVDIRLAAPVFIGIRQRDR